MFLFHLASNKEHLLQPQVNELVSHCSIFQLFSLYTLLDQLFISTTVAAKKTVSIHWDIIYPTCISHWTHMTQDFTTLICRHSSFSRPTKHHHRAIAVQTPTTCCVLPSYTALKPWALTAKSVVNHKANIDPLLTIGEGSMNPDNLKNTEKKLQTYICENPVCERTVDF